MGTTFPNYKPLRVKPKNKSIRNTTHDFGAHNSQNNPTDLSYKFRSVRIHTCSETIYVINYGTMHGLEW